MNYNQIRELTRDLKNSYQFIKKIKENNIDFLNYIYQQKYNLNKELFLENLIKYKVLFDKDFGEKIFTNYSLIDNSEKFNKKFLTLGFHESRILGSVYEENIYQSIYINNFNDISYYFYSIILTYDDNFFDIVYRFVESNVDIIILNWDYYIKKDFNPKEEPIFHFKLYPNYTEDLEDKFELLSNLIDDKISEKILDEIRNIINF